MRYKMKEEELFDNMDGIYAYDTILDKIVMIEKEVEK